MKKRILIFCVVIFGILFTGAEVYVYHNYTSQQIDNFTFWQPDSSVKVHITGGNDTTIINPASIINTAAVPDTFTHWYQGSTSTADTVVWTNFGSNRYKFSIAAGPVDTLKVFPTSVDSTTLYPNDSYSSDYISPASRPKTIIKPYTQGGTKQNYRLESEGR